MLVNNLENIYALHLEMKELTEQKKTALINGKIDELSKIIQEESLWIKKIKDLEENRIEIINKFLEAKKITSLDVTILDLLNSNIISKAEEIQLRDIYDKLIDLLDEIKKENEINTQLIKQSLDFVSHSLKTITQEPAQSITYSKPTNKQKNISSNTRIFDKKV